MLFFEHTHGEVKIFSFLANLPWNQVFVTKIGGLECYLDEFQGEIKSKQQKYLALQAFPGNNKFLANKYNITKKIVYILFYF